ncbi:MAG: TIGR01212 family radical SAM protein [Epsilonproteobacteria bacterium]|nr:TIGR01212 family radical SAM protein [Campylobacterota bacterium]
MQLYTFGKYLKNKFNTTVYKVPISIPGFTCPNIDGRVARGGCVFCENESFSPNLAKKERVSLNFESDNPIIDKQINSLRKQFFDTVPFLQHRFDAHKYIVYFQSFTNTYAPFKTLQTLYEEALKLPNVVGISIGTRTDSISDETLQYLSHLKNRTELWIEYGIQTSNDATLQLINRGHDFANVAHTITKTKQLGINVCGHVIYGLPNETKDDYKKTFTDSIALGIDSIKFHPLYVTKNTLLAKKYETGEFVPITQEEYAEILTWSIKHLPKHISIQRITAGVENLLAPSWCKNKSKQISYLHKYLNAHLH